MTGNRSSGLMPRIILMGRSIAASSLKRYGFDNKGKPQSAERMAFSLTGLEQCGANSVSPGLVSLIKFLGQDSGTNSLLTHWSYSD
eukprot:g3673.t1